MLASPLARRQSAPSAGGDLDTSDLFTSTAPPGSRKRSHEEVEEEVRNLLANVTAAELPPETPALLGTPMSTGPCPALSEYPGCVPAPFCRMLCRISVPKSPSPCSPLEPPYSIYFY